MKLETFKVYLVSFEIFQREIFNPGTVFFSRGQYDNDFKRKFSKNKYLRHKIRIHNDISLEDFIELISKKTGLQKVN